MALNSFEHWCCPGAARLLRVLGLLFAQPVLMLRLEEAALAINLSTAQRYVNRLEDVAL